MTGEGRGRRPGEGQADFFAGLAVSVLVLDELDEPDVRRGFDVSDFESDLVSDFDSVLVSDFESEPALLSDAFDAAREALRLSVL